MRIPIPFGSEFLAKPRYAVFEHKPSAAGLLKEAASMWDHEAERILTNAEKQRSPVVEEILTMIAESYKKKAARARELAGE